jgi:hypothetical protein
MTLVATDAAAQRGGEIVPLDFSCSGALEPPLDWVVAPTACAGDSLARACGLESGSDAGACREVATVAETLTDAQLAQCRPSAELLAAANWYYDDLSHPESRERAYVLYRALVTVPWLRSIALYRAARAAVRLDRYDEAVAYFGELFEGPPLPAALRAIAMRVLVEQVLTREDFDLDTRRDRDYPEARVGAPFLPDRPWAREAALAAYAQLRSWPDTSMADRLRSAIHARWPDIGDAAFPAPRPPIDGEGDFDGWALRESVRRGEFASCAPATGAVLTVHFTIADGASHGEATVTPAGPTATCVERAFEAARASPPSGGDASRDGVVVFVAP